MKFAGYIAPNLIFAMLIVLAWINLDWDGQGLQFQEAAPQQEQPLTVMYDGEYQYNGGKGDAYVLQYAQLELFPNNRIKVIQPVINGRAAGLSSGDTGSSAYKISGDLLTSTAADEFLVSGSPAEFSISSSDGRASGSGKQIAYELANQLITVDGSTNTGAAGGGSARLKLLQADGSQIDAAAQQIILQQAQQRVELAGQVELQHMLNNEELRLSGNQAVIDEERLQISGGITMRHLSTSANNRQVVAQAERGSYLPGGELHLIGKVKITDGGSTVDAGEAFYDANTASWRLAGETRSQQGQNSQDQNRVKIIIQQ